MEKENGKNSKNRKEKQEKNIEMKAWKEAKKGMSHITKKIMQKKTKIYAYPNMCSFLKKQTISKMTK